MHPIRLDQFPESHLPALTFSEHSLLYHSFLIQFVTEYKCHSNKAQVSKNTTFLLFSSYRQPFNTHFYQWQNVILPIQGQAFLEVALSCFGEESFQDSPPTQKRVNIAGLRISACTLGPWLAPGNLHFRRVPPIS